LTHITVNNVYSSSIKQEVIRQVSQLNVTSEENQKKQALLVISNNITISEKEGTQLSNQFKSFFSGVQPSELIQKLMSRPQRTISVLLQAFTAGPLAYLDYQVIAEILKNLADASKKDNLISGTFADQLFSPILSGLKKAKFPHANSLITAIQHALTPDSAKLISKLIGVSLFQKQQAPESVDLTSFFQALFKGALEEDTEKMTEFLILLAMQSKCSLKRVFAIMTLCQLHETKNTLGIYTQKSVVSHEIMLGLVLITLNDVSPVIREHGLKLASSVSKASIAADPNAEMIHVFTNTSKPQSVQKKANNLTPMKSNSVSQLLKELLAVKTELTADRFQL